MAGRDTKPTFDESEQPVENVAYSFSAVISGLSRLSDYFDEAVFALGAVQSDVLRA
jgi:hypothetical protein